jgi:hypoxanthine phosphoribosyltransferase
MRILLTAEQIANRVRDLGACIARDYDQTNPTLLCLLKGSALFLADLTRTISVPHTIEFMRASSYGAGTVSSGRVDLVPLHPDLAGRHVLVIEDIVDSGYTLQYITEYLWQKQPASLRVCALLDKPAAHRVDVKIDYCGFTIPDVFVVGYGLDWNERYRHLPYVAVIEDKDMDALPATSMRA